MQVDEAKAQPRDIYDFVKILRFKNNKVMLLGTGSLASQQYFSDYDLFSQIRSKQSVQDTYKYFMQILNNVNNDPNEYFIEFKIESKDKEKHKFYKIEDITEKEFKKDFKNVDFCKIDLVVKIFNTLIEMSIIYRFNQDPIDKQGIIKSLTEDQIELVKQGNYYKSLKRVFAKAKLLGGWNNKKLMVELSKLFNSETGHLYQINSNLKALKLLLENYNDPITIKKVKVNLKDLNVPADISIIDKLIKAYDTIINKEGKQFILDHKI